VKPAIKELDQLRDEIAQLTNTDDPILLQKYNKILIDYFVGLNFLGDKFTFGDDGVNITFGWKDS
jgi:FMN phosphatase YigB (HAD superfamily)